MTVATLYRPECPICGRHGPLTYDRALAAENARVHAADHHPGMDDTGTTSLLEGLTP